MHIILNDYLDDGEINNQPEQDPFFNPPPDEMIGEASFSLYNLLIVPELSVVLKLRKVYVYVCSYMCVCMCILYMFIYTYTVHLIYFFKNGTGDNVQKSYIKGKLITVIICCMFIFPFLFPVFIVLLFPFFFSSRIFIDFLLHVFDQNNREITPELVPPEKEFYINPQMETRQEEVQNKKKGVRREKKEGRKRKRREKRDLPADEK
jgi:hypothetical protein